MAAFLITWLRDHRALAVGEPWVSELQAVASYLEDERRALDEVLASLGSSPSLAKSVAGWLSDSWAASS